MEGVSELGRRQLKELYDLYIPLLYTFLIIYIFHSTIVVSKFKNHSLLLPAPICSIHMYHTTMLFMKTNFEI